MISRAIYSSINEEGLLKSLGPFRIIQSDKSISGVNKPEEEVKKPSIVGELIIYGEKIIVERKISESPLTRGRTAAPF